MVDCVKYMKYIYILLDSGLTIENIVMFFVQGKELLTNRNPPTTFMIGSSSFPTYHDGCHGKVEDQIDKEVRMRPILWTGTLHSTWNPRIGFGTFTVRDLYGPEADSTSGSDPCAVYVSFMFNLGVVRPEQN